MPKPPADCTDNRDSRQAVAAACLHRLDDSGGCGAGAACPACPVRRSVLETFQTGQGRHDVEAWLPFEDAGHPQARCLLLSTALLRFDHAERVLLCAQDITARKRAEQALRDNEQRFRLLYESMPVGYQSLDAEGRFIDVNHVWLDMLGYTRAEVIGRWFGDLLAPHLVAAFRERFEQFKAQGQGQFEYEMVRKDGTRATIAFTGRIGHDPAGAFRQTHCILADVTERRRLEEQVRQAQKMEAIGRLAAGVAHDFNNQLTIIRGYCDLLMSQRSGEDPTWEALLEIRRASDRAHSTTSHLLSFSRKQILHPQPVDLNALLLEMRNAMARIVGKGITLTVAAAPQLRPVLVDRSGMEQVVMNLIVNAADAMPDGGELTLRTGNVDLPAAQVRQHELARPGGYVLLEVCDSGLGMDGQTMERVFEPFFTTKDVGKGTGLGLPMVLGFIQQSNGFIDIASQVGKGTTARIYLPAAPAPAEPAPSPGPRRRPRKQPRHSRP